MSAKHKIKALRAYNRWRRGGPGPQPEIAYKRLEAAVNHE